MKRLLVILAALVLTLPAAAAESPAQQPLCLDGFFHDEDVYTVWAEYTSDAESLTVTFPAGDPTSGEQISTAYSYINHVLRIAIVSTEPLDLTNPVANVTQPGSEQAPALTLSVLRFNEEPVTVALTPVSLEVTQQSSGALTADVTALLPGPGNWSVVVAAYNGDGRMLAVRAETVPFTAPRQTVSLTLSGCAQAKQVKAFFLSESYAPLSAPLEKTL